MGLTRVHETCVCGAEHDGDGITAKFFRKDHEVCRRQRVEPPALGWRCAACGYDVAPGNAHVCPVFLGGNAVNDGTAGMSRDDG